MLESLFGNAVIEKILFYLVVNEECYPSQLKEVFQTPLFSFSKRIGAIGKRWGHRQSSKR
ncbi:MAG: hypothetical protein BGO14_03125 [Chlamydiales bacterium 38-26]|nr:MAG: hypothetical protein BGO14_03125 [Chlamydiales bacterium 38-26]